MIREEFAAMVEMDWRDDDGRRRATRDYLRQVDLDVDKVRKLDRIVSEAFAKADLLECRDARWWLVIEAIRLAGDMAAVDRERARLGVLF